jgi:hypothetical protein
MIVPLMGDTICHRNAAGGRFRGSVVGRHFDYSLANGQDGEEIDGTITVTLALAPLATH